MKLLSAAAQPASSSAAAERSFIARRSTQESGEGACVWPYLFWPVTELSSWR
jgi:hypothetical protein